MSRFASETLSVIFEVEDDDSVEDEDANVDTDGNGGGVETDLGKSSSGACGFGVAWDLTTCADGVALAALGFTGAGLKSTFGLRGGKVFGSVPGTGTGVFDVLGLGLVCGVVVARRRNCVNARGAGFKATDPYRPWTKEVLLCRQAVIELNKTSLG
jgi:hypothetical protein